MEDNLVSSARTSLRLCAWSAVELKKERKKPRGILGIDREEMDWNELIRDLLTRFKTVRIENSPLTTNLANRLHSVQKYPLVNYFQKAY